MKNSLLYTIPFLLVSVKSLSQTDGSNTVTANGQKVFKLVQKEAKFPGGAEGWKKYLEGNLKANLANRYIKLKKHEQEATQTVIVEFVVDHEGKTSNIVVTNSAEVHPKLAAEAIRVIKEGPVWEPATQNGKNVFYQVRQYITLLVSR